MSTFYWVGGSGTWDASTTTNWAASSGGAGGAGFPTATDDVVFDANSNVGTGSFTVTANTGAVCRNFTAGSLDGAMTLTLAAALTLYGNFTAAPTNFAVTSGTTALTFAGTDTQTITSAGVTLTAIALSGSGTVRQADALNIGARNLTINAGTFDTQGYNITANTITSTVALVNRTLNLNNSAVTLSANITITFTDQFAFNAGTSTITMSSAGASLFTPQLYGPGFTYYNVVFSAATPTTINLWSGTTANTYNNVTFSRPASASSPVYWVGDHVINGTLTFPSSSAITNRLSMISVSGRSNVSVAAVSASITNVDFVNMYITGAAAPLSGTNIGDGGGNSGITAAAGVNKYWNNTLGGNFGSASWALTSGGTAALANFPLPQDTIIIDNAGSGTGKTITIDSIYTFGAINAGGLTNATTLAFGANSMCCGSFTASAALTMFNTSIMYIGSKGAATATITTAGKTVSNSLGLVPSVGGTIQFADDVTITNSYVCAGGGTIDFNGKTHNIAGGTGLQKTIRGSNTLAFNGATITVQVNASFNQACYGNTTVTGPGTINMTRATAKSFTNTGCVDFGAIDLVQAGAGALTLSSGNAAVPGSYGTFKSLTATSVPSTVTFTAGQTFGFNSFSPAGTAGNLLTLNSSTAGTQATLTDSSGVNNLSYCSVKDLIATGGAIWNAFSSAGNVDGGNTSGFSLNVPSSSIYTRRKARRS